MASKKKTHSRAVDLFLAIDAKMRERLISWVTVNLLWLEPDDEEQFNQMMGGYITVTDGTVSIPDSETLPKVLEEFYDRLRHAHIHFRNTDAR